MQGANCRQEGHEQQTHNYQAQLAAWPCTSQAAPSGCRTHRAHSMVPTQGSGQSMGDDQRQPGAGNALILACLNLQDARHKHPDYLESQALALWLGSQHLLPHAASGARAASPAGGCFGPCPSQRLTLALRHLLCGAGSRPQLPSITERLPAAAAAAGLMQLPAASWQGPNPQPPGPQCGC